jgi:hypothetical protein
LAERDQVLAMGDDAVQVARLALAEASKLLLLYGLLGAKLAGVSIAELRRFARRPAQQGLRASRGR